MQMNRHSTVVSYLHRLVWLLTGNFGKPGTQYTPTPLIPWIYGDTGRTSPVVGAQDHRRSRAVQRDRRGDPDRPPRPVPGHDRRGREPRAFLGRQPAKFREALAALDTVVVIDVAMTETARLADYVLPASTQFEKAEATFFNFEFPDNAFHLRPALFEPPAGPLPEAEIHARLCEALEGFGPEDLAPLHEAAKQGLPAYGAAFMQHVLGNRRLSGQAAAILYRTLGPALPADRREGAVLLGLCFQFAMSHPELVAAAGFEGPPPMAAMALFQALLDTPTGVVFARASWEQVASKLEGGRIQLALPELIEAASQLHAPPAPDAAFPFVLSAGERRSFTANTIIRDPEWRKKDPAGALRINPEDASQLGVQTGERVRITTRRGSAEVVVEVSDTMRPGHVSLPNGLGLGRQGAATGVAPNELTSVEDRDEWAGTPWHKLVPARLEAIAS